jgi:large subunit ribosomal protein L29
MKSNELRNKSPDELKAELLSLSKEQFNLRMQKGASQNVQATTFKRVRRQIARIKTIMTEKEGLPV